MKLAVFASGSGSNFECLYDAAEAGKLDGVVSVCITDRDSAGVLERAHQFGIPSEVLKPQDFADYSVFGQSILDVLHRYEVDFIVLAGYLKKVPDSVVQQYTGRIINIHPSLLPAFGGKGMYGRRVHESVLAYGCKWTGATVHLVDTSYDTGPVVLQETVPVLPTDSPEQLAKRVLEVEHRILPQAVQLFAANRVSIAGRRVSISPSSNKPSAHATSVKP
jgi:phosphoribosylglycinamide formyltransferase-1